MNLTKIAWHHIPNFAAVKVLLRPVEVFVSTSIFTACCALGLCIATESGLPSADLPLLTDLHISVFGATLAIYNLPRLLPRPYGTPRARQPLRTAYFILFFAGLAMALPAALNLNSQTTITGIALAMLALAYYLPSLPLHQKKRLRDFGLLKIFVLASVWTIATAVLPMLYVNVSVTQYALDILIRFAFVFTLCILFDIRDVDTDRQRNINTLPVRIGLPSAYRLVYFTVLIFLILSALQFTRDLNQGRLIAAATTSFATITVAAYTRRHPGHSASFVAMTDGMMLLYALLVLLQ